MRLIFTSNSTPCCGHLPVSIFFSFCVISNNFSVPKMAQMEIMLTHLLTVWKT